MVVYMMDQSARQLAYHVLIDIQMNGAYANLALDKALLRSNLNIRIKDWQQT